MTDVDTAMERQRRRLLRGLAGKVSDSRVLDAFAAVRRERFTPPEARAFAYEDCALAIDAGQTISQPTMVAIMLEAMELRASDRVLEVGTGSGYQAALLSELAREVTTVERIARLARSARALLEELGYGNVRVELAGDALGYADGAPYDAIAVAAAAPRIPMSLAAQLAPRGRLVVPVGGRAEQNLIKATKTEQGVVSQALGACRFVPLIGREAWSESDARA